MHNSQHIELYEYLPLFPGVSRLPSKPYNTHHRPSLVYFRFYSGCKLHLRRIDILPKGYSNYSTLSNSSETSSVTHMECSSSHVSIIDAYIQEFILKLNMLNNLNVLLNIPLKISMVSRNQLIQFSYELEIFIKPVISLDIRVLLKLALN